MNVWIVATYKIKELKRLQSNLNNQGFNYYLPKIRIKQHHASVYMEELLFPGYVFINADNENYSKIKYTKGIKKVIQFSNIIAVLDDKDINEIKKIEMNSFETPIVKKIQIGQEATIRDGPLKGSFITIASLPRKERVDIFIHLLGKNRKVSALLNEINFLNN
jgi:transcription antitermination factor NusG